MSELKTLDQNIAKKKDELKRLEEKKRKLETGQKVVLGGMLLKACKDNPKQAQYALSLIDKYVDREADKKRLDGVIVELKKVANQQPSFNQS